MPDWGAIFEYRANYCGVKMQKLLGVRPNPHSFELFAGFGGDNNNVNRP